MSTAKFEKLIDLILNEDQERAEQLFHDIVVEKSREIYESLMSEDSQVEDLMQEISHEEEGIQEADEEMDMDMDMETPMGDEEVDVDAEMDDMGDEDMDMEMDTDMGDEDMDMDDEDMGDTEPATKEDIMNLEDKLDELMSEFEALMSKEEDESAELDDEEEEEEEEEEVMESVEMKPAPKPKHEDHKAHSPVAGNSGQTGMASKPVKFSGDHEATPNGPKAPHNAYTKGEGQLPGAGKFKNAPGGGSNVDKGESAPKPKHEMVKAKSPVPESRTSKKKIIK
jgi:hypothetical protein